MSCYWNWANSWEKRMVNKIYFQVLCFRFSTFNRDVILHNNFVFWRDIGPKKLSKKYFPIILLSYEHKFWYLLLATPQIVYKYNEFCINEMEFEKLRIKTGKTLTICVQFRFKFRELPEGVESIWYSCLLVSVLKKHTKIKESVKYQKM